MASPPRDVGLAAGEMDISWASVSRKAISQVPLGVCAAGDSCRLDSAQVLMMLGSKARKEQSMGTDRPS